MMQIIQNRPAKPRSGCGITDSSLAGWNNGLLHKTRDTGFDEIILQPSATLPGLEEIDECFQITGHIASCSGKNSAKASVGLRH